MYHDYYQASSYSDIFVRAALDGVSTSFPGSNANFSSVDVVVRAQFAATSNVVLGVWMCACAALIQRILLRKPWIQTHSV